MRLQLALVLVFTLHLYHVHSTAGIPSPRTLRQRQTAELPTLNGQELWFEQRVDHFDRHNTDTYQQKYTVNDTFYGGSRSPVFIFLGGEAPLEFFGFQEVQALLWAQQFSALYLAVEHRFYGASNPTPDFSTKSLRLLTSQQAIADAASFIISMKQQYNSTGPWVVFGCSYSGALSAWFRLKHPELVVASVAPSGPVEALLDFPGYYGQFSKSAAPDCVKGAQKASQQIMQMLSSEAGRQTLAQYFGSCTSTIRQEDTYMFLYSIIEVLGAADQMSNPPDWTLNQTCNQFLTGDADLVKSWGNLWTGGSSQCTNFSEAAFIESLEDTSISGNSDGGRAWTWQTCVEFGFFATSYANSSVFFPNLDVGHQVQWCSEIFGIPGMVPDIAFTNQYYGGFSLPGSNIIFTNGNLDPWHLLSINEDFTSGSVLAANYEAGHCGTMIRASSVDPPSLVAARQKVGTFLSKVLH